MDDVPTFYGKWEPLTHWGQRGGCPHALRGFSCCWTVPLSCWETGANTFATFWVLDSKHSDRGTRTELRTTLPTFSQTWIVSHCFSVCQADPCRRVACLFLPGHPDLYNTNEALIFLVISCLVYRDGWNTMLQPFSALYWGNSEP